MSSPNAKYTENFSESEEKMLALPEVWNFVERSIGKMKMQLRPIDWHTVEQHVALMSGNFSPSFQQKVFAVFSLTNVRKLKFEITWQTLIWVEFKPKSTRWTNGIKNRSRWSKVSQNQQSTRGKVSPNHRQSRRRSKYDLPSWSPTTEKKFQLGSPDRWSELADSA